MATPHAVTLAELRAAADALLSHLEASGVDAVELRHDHYWSVPHAARYDPHAEPAGLTLGQLSDDLAEVRAIAAGEREPVGYALVWLASLLRYVGENAGR